ncbi:MAG: PEGA domain-containing protein [Myxococcales bacterium]|nr:PEGA domain-containing protein [Myxococcales bacterium]
MHKFFLALALVGAAVTSSSAHAAEGAESDADTAEARRLFLEGNAHAKAEEWSLALAAFEKSRAKRAHALTTFNMAVCERALGRLTRARRLFLDVMSPGVGELPASRLEETKGYLASLEAELVTLTVVVEPVAAALTVDGRPIETTKEHGHVAGLANPGPPVATPASPFALTLDPGVHFFRIVAKGYKDVTLTRTFSPGEKTKLNLALDTLPATLRVSSNVPRPIVRVNGADVGLAPVEVSRPRGAYRVQVVKEGFEPFHVDLDVAPGQELDVPARLSPEVIPITKKWWFWTIIGAGLAGGAGLTYALTREPAAPPAFDGGTTGWVVTPR